MSAPVPELIASVGLVITAIQETPPSAGFFVVKSVRTLITFHN